MQAWVPSLPHLLGLRLLELLLVLALPLLRHRDRLALGRLLLPVRGRRQLQAAGRAGAQRSGPRRGTRDPPSESDFPAPLAAGTCSAVAVGRACFLLFLRVSGWLGAHLCLGLARLISRALRLSSQLLLLLQLLGGEGAAQRVVQVLLAAQQRGGSGFYGLWWYGQGLGSSSPLLQSSGGGIAGRASDPPGWGGVGWGHVRVCYFLACFVVPVAHPEP
jgi:hypothetical protein